MKFYYAIQTKRWLNDEEQKRFHIDYEPQDSKESALVECRRFLTRGALQYLDAVRWRFEEIEKLPSAV